MIFLLNLSDFLTIKIIVNNFLNSYFIMKRAGEKFLSEFEQSNNNRNYATLAYQGIGSNMPNLSNKAYRPLFTLNRYQEKRAIKELVEDSTKTKLNISETDLKNPNIHFIVGMAANTPKKNPFLQKLNFETKVERADGEIVYFNNIYLDTTQLIIVKSDELRGRIVVLDLADSDKLAIAVAEAYYIHLSNNGSIIENDLTDKPDEIE